MVRTWEVQGRNGKYAVDEYHEDSSGQYGRAFIAPSRELAEDIANRLNAAYEAGLLDAQEGVL